MNRPQNIANNNKYGIAYLLLSCLLLLLTATAGKAQFTNAYTAGKFLIKGKVIDVQSRNAVPLANIMFNSSNKGITCDNEGYFTLYVYKTDTLKFSSTGYISKTIHIADLDSVNYYTLEIQLIHDFIKLKEVTIYPFRTKEEFTEAFLETKTEQLVVAGVAPPKYSKVPPKAKFYNPISFLYDRVKKRRAANPDFKP